MNNIGVHLVEQNFIFMIRSFQPQRRNYAKHVSCRHPFYTTPQRVFSHQFNFLTWQVTTSFLKKFLFKETLRFCSHWPASYFRKDLGQWWQKGAKVVILHQDYKFSSKNLKLTTVVSSNIISFSNIFYNQRDKFMKVKMTDYLLGLVLVIWGGNYTWVHSWICLWLESYHSSSN